jgi:RND family efflux transporter MFP subunit
MLTSSGSTRRHRSTPTLIRTLGAPAILALSLAFATGVSAAPLGCLIEPNQVGEIGSPVIGVLERVDVERGDLIKKGQVLAQLTADVERAAVAVAEARAQSQAELQAAATAQDYAKRKQTRGESLVRNNYISQQAQDQTETEAAVAEFKLHQARDQKKLSAQELTLARAQLAQRTIKSPISGVVVERYLTQGERVDDKPVVRVAAVDPLRVEVVVPALQFNKIQTGMIATVTPDLPNAGERKAKVTLVDHIVDAASNTFRVRLELPNPDNALPAGLRCKVALGGDNVAQSDAKRPAAGAAPAVAANKPAVATTTADKPVQPTAPAVAVEKVAKPTAPIAAPAHAVPGVKPIKAVAAAG